MERRAATVTGLERQLRLRQAVFPSRLHVGKERQLFARPGAGIAIRVEGPGTDLVSGGTACSPRWVEARGTLQHHACMPPPFVVIDCETTGFGRNDRIVEIAAVTLHAYTREVTSEYTTLLNPQGDVGPVDIHGVTPAMVETAPVFEEIAGALAARLDGAVLVAHNLPFDSRMIAQEFERLGAQFAPGKGICTLQATSENLSVACARYGIELRAHHCALADARATAALMKRCIKARPATVPASIGRVPWVANARTLPRER